MARQASKVVKPGDALDWNWQTLGSKIRAVWANRTEYRATIRPFRFCELFRILPKQVWAIRARHKLAGNPRDLALFSAAIDSKLRDCILVTLNVAGYCEGRQNSPIYARRSKQNEQARAVRIV